MSKRRFRAITRELRYTNANPPPFPDKFWEVRQLIKAFNDRMMGVFNSGCAFVLMSQCQSGTTCTPVLDGSSVHANPTLWEMSTTLHVVH